MNDQQQSRADALMDRIDDAIYRHIPPRVALENAKALYSMGAELLTAAPADDACKRCGSTTARACNDAGCFYLESGDGEPSAAPADERAALLAWAVDRWDAEVKNRPLINMHRRSLDDTWRQVIRHCGGDDVSLLGPRHDDLLAANPIGETHEARAAASPAASSLTDEQREILEWCGKYHACRVTEGTYHYRIAILINALLSAPQPAQADAPAEAREPLNEVLFGNDESLEMAADALDRLGQESAAAGVRALRMLAHKMRCAPADAGEAAPFGWARPKGGNYFTRNELSAKRIGGLVPVYAAPPASRMARLTDEQRESIEHAATWLGRSEDLQNKAHAKRLCALLNGMDHDR